MEEKPHQVKRLPENKREKIFVRFKVFASRLFISWEEKPKTDQRLTGRILSIKDDAGEVLLKLNTIKKDLEIEADPDLICSIEAVVNPIIRDAQKLQRKEEPTCLEEQLKTLKEYTQWIDKAKPWASFFSHNLSNRTAVLQAVVKHSIKNSAEMIERDLQVIYDYEKHKLLESGVSIEEQIQLQQLIEKDLAKLVQKLSSLQNDIPDHPEELSLKQLETWKTRVAKRREEYYNESLQAIDKVISTIAPISLTPTTTEQTLNDHIVQNLSRIINLESSIKPLLNEIEESEPLDQRLRIEFRTRLEPLEKDANMLHQELELTPELEDRLQAVQQLLDEAKMRLVA
jgi:hypothetical protein